jgi:hypothetical protein
MQRFSDWIVYVDESGDHSLSSIDANYPIFSLALCLFRKTDYVNEVLPRLHDLKFKWFGHDLVVLHENEISKRKGAFGFLQYDGLREAFQSDLNSLVAATPMTVFASVILKTDLVRRYAVPASPYELALLFCLERVWECLRSTHEAGNTIHVVCESRSPRLKPGRGREDLELEVEFRRIVEGRNTLQGYDSAMPDLDIVFADKQSNSAGLQLADLIARPVGLKVLRPEQPNRAFEIIASKIWRRPGQSLLSGMKAFP